MSQVDTDACPAMKAAQAKHQERLTGPQRCCVKVSPDNMPCGEPVEYRTAAPCDPGFLSGWYHVAPQDHHAVPASYAR